MQEAESVWRNNPSICKIVNHICKCRRALQNPEEIGPLLWIISQRNPRMIVEIGSLWGWTLWAFGKVVSPGATLISIDFPCGSMNKHGDRTKFVPFRLRDTHAVHLIEADSQLDETADKLMEVLNGRTADFLFIDGDHRLEYVTRDFELYAPMTRGLVGFHDVAERSRHKKTMQVDRFWYPMKDSYKHAEFIEEGARRVRGIGVIEYPKTMDRQ